MPAVIPWRSSSRSHFLLTCCVTTAIISILAATANSVVAKENTNKNIIRNNQHEGILLKVDCNINKHHYSIPSRTTIPNSCICSNSNTNPECQAKENQQEHWQTTENDDPVGINSVSFETFQNDIESGFGQGPKNTRWQRMRRVRSFPVDMFSSVLPGKSSGPSSLLVVSTRETLFRQRKQFALPSIPRGGGAEPSDGEVSALVDDAYTWSMNLGQPAALIAGAVIATIYENIGNGDLDILPEDSRLTKFKKRLTTSLLVSAFGLEITAIFVTTVTGTMLLSRPLHDMDHLVPLGPHTTPLAFLRENFEFEYLTARVAYLQGLLNWIAAIAVSHIIPRTGESQETRLMNSFISSALFCTIALMVAFYNKHMSFYHNYAEMLAHWGSVIMRRFFFVWPPRLMGVVYIPAILSTVYWGYRGFFGRRDLQQSRTKKEKDQSRNNGSENKKKSTKKGE